MIIDISNNIKKAKINWKETFDKFQENNFCLSLVLFAVFFGVFGTLAICFVLWLFKQLFMFSLILFWVTIVIIAVAFIRYLIIKIKENIVKS